MTEAENGRVIVTAGTVHGGFAATLLDSCMGLAIWSTLEKGVGQTTLEFKISLVRPITPETGLIRAEGIVLNRGDESALPRAASPTARVGCWPTARRRA